MEADSEIQFSSSERSQSWLDDYRAFIVIIFISLFLLLPGLFILPPIDRDESRFAEASRNMVVSDSWKECVVPRIQGKPRLNKPPLIYWIQATSVRVFSNPTLQNELPSVNKSGSNLTLHYLTGNIWAYRIPSVLSAVIAALFTFVLGRSLFHARAGFLASIILISCMVVMIDARQARADQLLLACICASQFFLWTCWKQFIDKNKIAFHSSILLWISIAIGIMTKGPVAPAIACFTIVGISIWMRNFRWIFQLRLFTGLVILLIFVIPWMYLVSKEVGQENFFSIINDEVFGRSVSAQEGHTGPPGYYLLLLPILFWPASVGLLPGLVRSLHSVFAKTSSADTDSFKTRLFLYINRFRAGDIKNPASIRNVFLLSWLIPGWFTFEIVATKLPHYTLPMFPALAIIVSRGLIGGKRLWSLLRANKIYRAAQNGWFLISLVILLIIPSLLLYNAWSQIGMTFRIIIAVCIMINQFIMIKMYQLIKNGKLPELITCGICASFLFHLGMLQFLLPQWKALWLSPRIIHVTQEYNSDFVKPVAAIGYDEDSLVFLSRGRIERIPRRAVESWLEQNPDGLLWSSIENEEIKTLFDKVESLEGLNYSKGKRVSTSLYIPKTKEKSER